jgi:hypothetical protein
LVAENQTSVGVRYIALKRFLREGKLVRVERNNLSQRQQRILIARINQRLGRKYRLLFYNCEHFVNDVLHGKAFSKQIQKGVLGVLAFGLFVKAA